MDGASSTVEAVQGKQAGQALAGRGSSQKVGLGQEAAVGTEAIHSGKKAWMGGGRLEAATGGG